jgi:hypothetical protein
MKDEEPVYVNFVVDGTVRLWDVTNIMAGQVQYVYKRDRGWVHSFRACTIVSYAV